MSRLVVGPFNRVEGDLEVRLDLADGRVRSAEVSAPLYRGFEAMLIGRVPEDALAIVPRLCGICSVSQSAAAAFALADAAGISAPPNGQLAANLVLACENLADHLAHFYLFFMPDFARPAYAQRPWFPAVHTRFAAGGGTAGPEAMAARTAFFHIAGLLAGKWPHTLALAPGGTTRAPGTGEKIRLRLVLAGFRQFLETRLFGCALEAFAGLATPAQLAGWQHAAAPESCDLRLFLHAADELGLAGLGRLDLPLMSFGAYVSEADGRLFRAGLIADGALHALDPGDIREDTSHAWLRSAAPLPPAAGRTEPDIDVPGAYTWCKAPRLSGRPVEVGALARQLVDGQPLLRALHGGNGRNGGTNVVARVLARAVELARVVPAMERWSSLLEAGAPCCVPAPLPAGGSGIGLIEAARGSLGHWLGIDGGRIRHYQIIAPTTWNFSPRSADGVPGPLEQALIGTAVEPGETVPLAVQHVVRSFDPCMSCTVH